MALETSNEPGKGSEGEASLESIAQTIAGRQGTIDDSLVINGKYLIGTAVGICISRSNNKFVSLVEVDGGGGAAGVTATFRIMNPAMLTGKAIYNVNGGNNPNRRSAATATGKRQIFKLATASITLGLKARVIEIGIRSSLGIQVNGLCNFSDTKGYDEIDFIHCGKYEWDENATPPPSCWRKCCWLADLRQQSGD